MFIVYTIGDFFVGSSYLNNNRELLIGEVEAIKKPVNSVGDRCEDLRE